jgi:hypothetical protein
MQLLRHMGLDIQKFSSLKVLKPHAEQFQMIFSGENTISVWSCPIDSRDYDLQQLCSEEDYDIDLTKVADIQLSESKTIQYTSTLSNNYQ